MYAMLGLLFTRCWMSCFEMYGATLGWFAMISSAAFMCPGMQPADIAGLVEVSDPRVSPDGRTIAFVVTTVDLEANRYRGRVWLAAADGSEPPRPFTAGEHRDGRPRWSPDGRELAFVSHREGEGSELYVLPVTGGGELRRAASWPE